MSNGELMVFVTSPKDIAASLAETLVAEHLAACVNIIPGVTSIFFWEGKVCQEAEVMLLIKTTKSSWNQLMVRVKELHTYDIPEIVSLPIMEGFQPYLDWINKSCVAKKST
jgi:periplasmic divalent cation tolerance protein